MLSIYGFCNLFAVFFAMFACFLNIILLFSILYLKLIPIKSSMSLIYYKFGIDAFYTFSICISRVYIPITMTFVDYIIKNMSFYLFWASTSFGSLRAVVALAISLERAVASLFPIFYHNIRPTFSNKSIWFFMVSSVLLDQYILFGYCGNVIETPKDCVNLQCSTNQCYITYWSFHERITYLANIVLCTVVVFRMFIWNNYFSKQTSKTISRATRIALFDTVFITVFNTFPAFILVKVASLNFKAAGSFTYVTKTLGLMVEALITYRILFGRKKVSPIPGTPLT
ncbi:Serpentine Receptor, class BC (Class B-like) [Caenorhabditis elegans]|uniref:Serpentine Receptor, class BC (Class B-like) n=1 Tax=Caenorhabditis elegans TaxID=6239 RepID=O45280_CAEEL|nr:Serpentine Receptor, class BC (Class B-like) [Caenorhabditis elegans]CAB05685.2 Serpentine Receptor, class BC (Class B-like) [Caenorhabditis elegans]|eukprot:NP_507116.2 Serpentine Receptor, class BC (class B-like) [Caenorhabditis elegans]